MEAETGTLETAAPKIQDNPEYTTNSGYHGNQNYVYNDDMFPKQSDGNTIPDQNTEHIDNKINEGVSTLNKCGGGLYIKVSIKNKVVLALIDTGSDRNIMSSKLYIYYKSPLCGPYQIDEVKNAQNVKCIK